MTFLPHWRTESLRYGSAMSYVLGLALHRGARRCAANVAILSRPAIYHGHKIHGLCVTFGLFCLSKR